MRRSQCRFVCYADAKTVPPCRGMSPEGAEGVLRPQKYPRTHPRTHKRVGKREKSYSRAWETPPALRATSPIRRRSFASGRINSLLRWISNLSHHVSGEASISVKSPRIRSAPPFCAWNNKIPFWAFGKEKRDIVSLKDK